MLTVLVTSFAVWLTSFIGAYYGLTQPQVLVASIMVFAIFFWILEPIPVYATSIIIILMEVLLLSDEGLIALLPDQQPVLKYQDVFATLASPIIILFLGGFMLAIAASKYRLDVALAGVLLKPFGDKPANLILGMMLVTAFFSMFMSNTATTVMMLAILTPVLGTIGDDPAKKKAFVLSIPIAANIGGIGTPIGTPPNAIALEYLAGDLHIGFGQWMSFAIPYTVILLVLSWQILLKLFKPSSSSLHLNFEGAFGNDRSSLIVYGTFILTLFLWLTDFLHGINAYVIALIPVAIFLSTGIVTKRDIGQISWDVLWLVSGGIALGLALDKSGLISTILGFMDFSEWSLWLLIIGLAIIALIMANFMSNTATANLLLPIVAILGASLEKGNSIVGMLLLSTTIACSLGMSLPVSTPPNALAYGTGLFKTKDMAVIGVAATLVGLLLLIIMIWFLSAIRFF